MARYRRRIYLAEGKLGSSMKFSYPNMHMQNTRRALVVVTLVCYLISISCCNLGATVVRRKIRNHRCIMRQDYADYWISGWWRGRCVCLCVHVVRDRSPTSRFHGSDANLRRPCTIAPSRSTPISRRTKRI